MKKRKTYEISIIDKTYSKTISDETKFYTSDTALELVFKLKETGYNFESAEIVLLNIDDRSLVTRPVAKVLDSFAYELDDDITAHYGEWRGQLRFEQAGETYVSSPVKFRIENDLSNDRPPQLSDVQSWVSLKRYADSLTEELKQAVLEVEGMDDMFNANELERQNQFETAEQSRQTTFETNESERAETFESNETTRQAQELEREKSESQRQSVFDDNEVNREETFNANEATRQENETTRQQAESQRQSIFETAEQGRQSGEDIRIENENQRNLTSVDEFIKLQVGIGGRNLILNSNNVAINRSENGNNNLMTPKGELFSIIPINDGNVYGFNTFVPSETLLKGETYTISFYISTNSEIEVLWYAEKPYARGDSVPNTNGEIIRYSYSYEQKRDNFKIGFIGGFGNVKAGEEIVFGKFKLEKSSVPTHYTRSPEDYTVVSKEDYYNHIKLMNDFKDTQFNQLQQAVIALGGTI